MHAGFESRYVALPSLFLGSFWWLVVRVLLVGYPKLFEFGDYWQLQLLALLEVPLCHQSPLVKAAQLQIENGLSQLEVAKCFNQSSEHQHAAPEVIVNRGCFHRVAPDGLFLFSPCLYEHEF